MSSWDDFEKEAQQVEIITNKNFYDVVILIKTAVGLFGNAFSIADDQDGSNVTVVKMSLLSHNFGVLKCSVNLMLRGYYTQSRSLLRVVYENWVAFHYLSVLPGEADRWQERKVPKHDTMLKKLVKLNKDSQSAKNLRGWHDTFCSFSHTSSANLLPYMSYDYMPNEKTIHYGTTFESTCFRASAYAICVWIDEMLLAISSWIPDTGQWYIERIEIEKKLMKFVDQENKKFTPS